LGIGSKDIYSGIGNLTSSSKMTSINSLYDGAGITTLAKGTMFDTYKVARGAMDLVENKQLEGRIKESERTYRLNIDVKGISSDPDLVQQISRAISSAVTKKVGNKVTVVLNDMKNK
jgi:hypothetical protein